MIELIHIAYAAEEAAGGPAATLGLNVKLFIGQLINFGILLFIFWKLILPKVVTGLQSRSERIEKALKDAENTEKEKQEFSKWKDTEMTKVRSQSQAIITAAQSEAGKAKQLIIDETKAEQQKLVQQAKVQIEFEKNKSIMEAKGELADMITQASEKILRKKLDTHQDRELIKESLANIK